MEKFIAQRFAPVGYAAEYLIPSLSDVLATIALPHSVTYLLRGVNGETLDLQFPNSPSPPHTSLCLSTRYVTYRNMCRTPHPQPSIHHQQTCLIPFAKTGQACIYTSTYQRCGQARLIEYVIPWLKRLVHEDATIIILWFNMAVHK